MNYTQEVEKKLKKKVEKNDLEELEVKIAFFQHERLIHLLVTLAFAIFALVFLALGMVSYVFLIIFAILIIIGLILNKKRKERKFANQIIDAKIEEKRGENKWKQ